MSDAPQWLALFQEKGSVPVTGVIHVGAHEGWEYDDYAHAGIARQVWFEPIPEFFERLVQKLPMTPEIQAFRVACGSEPGHLTLHLVDGYYGQCSSLLKPKRIMELHPGLSNAGEIKVEVARLDDLLQREKVDLGPLNLMVLDTQGYELEVLKGAERTVAEAVDYLVVEVVRTEMYEGCAFKKDVDEWVLSRGFVEVDTRWRGPEEAEADSFYVKKERLREAK